MLKKDAEEYIAVAIANGWKPNTMFQTQFQTRGQLVAERARLGSEGPATPTRLPEFTAAHVLEKGV